MHTIDIGPVSTNPDASIKIIFGDNVSADRILKSIVSTTKHKQDAGMINDLEALEIIKEAEVRVRHI